MIAGAGITNSTDFDAGFKRNYNDGTDAMKVQQNLNAKLWSLFEVSPLKPSGQGLYTPIVMQGNETAGSIWENEGFPDPDPIVPVQPVIYSKTFVSPFQVTGKSIDLSASDKVAFARSLDSQQKDNMGRSLSGLNRQAMGTGTGQVTLANGAGSASTSLVVDDPHAFRVGMYVDIWTAVAGTKQVAGIKINTVNLSTKTLTLASAQTWSDNSIVVMRGAFDGATSTSYKEMMGFRGIADTSTYSTTFEGQSVTTYPQWQGNVIAAGNVPVSQDLLQQSINRSAIIGDDVPDTLLSNYGQARTYINQEIAKTEYEPGEIKGGNITLQWGNLKWLVNPTYPIGEIGFMVKKGINKFQVRDLHISDLPGQTLYQIQGRHAIGGYYNYEGNIGTWKRNNQTRLTELTEPTL